MSKKYSIVDVGEGCGDFIPVGVESDCIYEISKIVNDMNDKTLGPDSYMVRCLNPAPTIPWPKNIKTKNRI